MTLQELLRHVQRGELSPLYYFWGPERWLIDDALRKIEEKALDPATREFNREVLDGEVEDAETILSSLQVFPVRSPWRLVMIRRADRLWKKASGPFVEYFRNPNPRTCAVFIGEKTDQRTRFFQAIEENGAVVPFFPPYERDIQRWVRSRAELFGHPISEGAVSLILERVGPTLLDIEAELQKLVLGKGAGQKIGEEDVRALTQDTRTENPFDLARAVARLDFQGSMRLLAKNLQQGDSPVLLFSLMMRQLRLVRRAGALLAGGLSKKEAEKRLRILPRAAQDFWGQVDRFPPTLLEKLWPLGLKTDQSLKLSRSNKNLLLEEFILTVLGEARLPEQTAPSRVGERKKGGRES
jgi:DNA polymerase III subunit delta